MYAIYYRVTRGAYSKKKKKPFPCSAEFLFPELRFSKLPNIDSLCSRRYGPAVIQGQSTALFSPDTRKSPKEFLRFSGLYLEPYFTQILQRGSISYYRKVVKAHVMVKIIK